MVPQGALELGLTLVPGSPGLTAAALLTLLAHHLTLLGGCVRESFPHLLASRLHAISHRLLLLGGHLLEAFACLFALRCAGAIALFQSRLTLLRRHRLPFLDARGSGGLALLHDRLALLSREFLPAFATLAHGFLAFLGGEIAQIFG